MKRLLVIFIGGLFECRLQENHDQMQDSQLALRNPSRMFFSEPWWFPNAETYCIRITWELGRVKARATELQNAI